MGKTIGVVLKLTDRCSPVVQKIAKAFGATEKKAKSLSTRVKTSNRVLLSSVTALAGAFTAVTTGIVTQTKKISEYGDHIDKMSKRVGLSSKEYQKWDFIMSQNGGSVDNLAGGIKSLTKHIGNAKSGTKESVKIFKTLGVSLNDTNGKLRSQEDIFNDCVRAIQNIKNPTEQAIIGQKLFSKGFQEMAPLLSQTSASVEKLKKEYDSLGLGISDSDIQKAVNMTDTMDKLGRSFNIAGMQIGITLLPYVQELANTIITNLPQIQNTLIPIFKSVGSVLGFCIKHIQGVTIGIVALTTAITAAKVAMLLFGTSTVFALGPIIATVGATITAIGALALAFRKLRKSREEALKKQDNENITPNEIPVVANKKEKIKQHHALGTSSTQGGTALVGEYGPELVSLPRGASIMSANNTKEKLNSSSNITINMNIAGNVIGNREFTQNLLSLMALELRKVMPA